MVSPSEPNKSTHITLTFISKHFSGRKAMRPALIIVYLFLIQIGSFAGQVVINGHVDNGSGRSIQLITFVDYLSKQEKVLASGSIGEDGSFQLEFELQETCLAYLKSGFQKGELYLEPDQHYKVRVNLNEDQYHFNFSVRGDLEMQIEDSGAPGLNRLIRDFNSTYNQLMINEFGDSYSRISKDKVLRMMDSLNNMYAQSDNAFFREYIRYRLALLELSSRVKSKGSIASEYLEGQAILYNNVEYMEFFSQFFSQMLITSTNIISSQDLKEMVNTGADYLPMEDKLRSLSYLENPRLRELVLIKSLQDLYFTGGFDRKQILKFLKQVGNRGSYKQNKIIASNLVTELTRFARGTEAPDIKAEDETGITISVRDLLDMPAYIIFYNSKNLSCIAEMDLVKELLKDFSGKIQFISISLDDSFETMERVKQERGYDWSFFYTGINEGLLGNYRINKLPHCTMLNSRGLFIDHSAPFPSENLAGYLYRVLQD
jgi:hypothetical protein